MCDRIKMPDGLVIESIRADGECLCNSQSSEILEWIVKRVALDIGLRLIIERDPFGWVVSIEDIEVTCTGTSSIDSTGLL